MRSIFTKILISCLSTHAQAGFFEDHARGWHWYEVKPKKEDPKALKGKPKEAPQKITATVVLTPTQVFKAVQKELKSRLHLALLNPTFENVKSYQEYQHRWMDQSDLFSKTWMKVVYNTPELDDSQLYPQTQAAQSTYYEKKEEETTGILKEVAKEYGLFFFFRSDCAYCHKLAPLVKEFASAYGFDVLGISVDGEPIEGFEDAAPDNGSAKNLGVKTVPSVFAVNPNTKEVIPFVRGFASLEEMKTRMVQMVKPIEKSNSAYKAINQGDKK
ncbi:MAG TPA: conjugal transfer protein TraF [Alphaproteobacteria bacterium]|nr:conjugal transfer protein TraF [Alphaproteobacteria bacterium]